jgi:galactose mutarotase-like enzyme
MHYTHERNWGCRASDEYTYRGLRVLVMENELIRVSLLLDRGTSIFEFLYKPRDVDFMFRHPNGVRNPATHIESIASRIGPFMDFNHGGWPEVLPNAGRTCDYKGAEFGLHGEVYGLPWRHQITEDTPDGISVKLWVRTCRTPFYLEKTLTLRRGRAVLEIEERLGNEGREPMELMWGHHPTFAAPFLDETTVLDAPAKRVVIDGVADPYSRFEPFQEFDWPNGPARGGGVVDIRAVPPTDSAISDMAYLTDLTDGWFAITSQSRGLGFGMSWDLDTFRHIWWWMAYGGNFGYPFYGRCFAMAVEPMSSYPAILPNAIAKGTQLRMEPGEERRTWLRAAVYEGAQRPRGIGRDGEVLR